MISVKESLQQLSARLPELEWKLGTLHITPKPYQLPRGLFRERFELTAESCIDEIKADLKSLHQQHNELSAHYLAQRVSQKINVLVRLCQQRERKKPTLEPQTAFGIQALSTRQQWLTTLHEEIIALSKQQQALTTALIHLESSQNTQAVLSMRVELGELERRLTLARENLERITA